jgi:hypothetical protein
MKDSLNGINTYTDIWLNAIAGLCVPADKLKVVGNPGMSPGKFVPCRIKFEPILDQLSANVFKQRNFQRRYLFHFFCHTDLSWYVSGRDDVHRRGSASPTDTPRRS